MPGLIIIIYHYLRSLKLFDAYTYKMQLCYFRLNI